MTRIAIIGDALLDRDVTGTADRLCPDAPVPVVQQSATVDRPGGAALAACIAADLGASVDLLVPLADDPACDDLVAALRSSRVAVHRCRQLGATVEKIRIRVDGRSLLRLDRGVAGPVAEIPADIDECVAQADAVLVSDYGQGATSADALRAVVSRAIARHTPVVWDPHPRGAAPVPGTTVVTPNRGEAAALAGVPAGGFGECTLAARGLLASWSVGAIAITLGADGALLVAGDGAPLAVPVERPVAAADCCGAGDAFAAGVALALARGALLSEAVESAVQQAGDYVARGGASGFRHEADGPTASLRPHGVVVATSGCFDLLHAGHVRLLEQARRLGDWLVVLLNSDGSVRRLKGPDRPVQPAADRAAVLRSLGCVDEVVVFDEETPVTALGRLRPALFVKGGDYYGTAEIPEAAAMASWNGTVVTLPFLSGRSTTRLLQLARGGSDAQ